MARKKKKRRERRKKRGPGQFVGPVPGWVSAQIGDLLDEERPEEALELLEEWGEKRPNHPALLFYMGCAYLMMDDLLEALKHLRAAGRQDRRNEAVLHNLVPVYLGLGFFSHCLRVLRRYQRTELAFEKGNEEELSGMRASLEEHQREAAAHFNVAPDLYDEARYWDEEAQIAQQEGIWKDAISASNKALSILPEFPPALNNRAMSYYFSGRFEEAIADEERVVEADPQNVHALTNLTRFHYLRDEQQQMRTRFEQLQGLPTTAWEFQSEPIFKMLEAYAVAASDDEIYAFLVQQKKELPPRGWYMLGAVAANRGRRREARRAWKQVEDDGMGWEQQAADALQALEAGEPGLGRASRFTYCTPYELLSRDQVDLLADILEEYAEDEQIGQREIEEVVRQHPGIFEAVRWFMWNTEDLIPAIHMLALLGTDKAFAELQSFALGQAGTDEERMQAAQLLEQEGRLPVDQPLRMWLRGEWREILLKKFKITEEPEDQSYSEEVLDLLTRAGEAFRQQDLDRAEQIYQRILKLDERCCPAYNNLARIAGEQGDVEESRAYLEKSLEINPDYVMGRCNLAHYYLMDGEIEAAQELIGPLVERRQFAAFEMKAYQLIQARIQIYRGDLDAAENILSGLTELYPDDPEVEELAERMGVLRPMGDLVKRVSEDNRKKRERDDRRPLDDQASLETCLHLHSRDVLQFMVRHLGMTGVSGLRKAELVDAVAAHLRSAHNLEQAVAELPEHSRTALNYVLEQGGVASWEEFSRHYGNDREESPYWQWVEPKTTMGLLRACGLLYAGTASGEQRVLIPAELRALLRVTR